MTAGINGTRIKKLAPETKCDNSSIRDQIEEAVGTAGTGMNDAPENEDKVPIGTKG